MAYRWLVSDVTILLEASLAILLLGWDIVRDVGVVALLREPDDDDDDVEEDDTLFHYDGKIVMRNPHRW